MTTRDTRDIIAGAMVAAIGLGAGGYSLLNYPTGSIARMDYGFFPLVVGLVTGICGLSILVPALLRGGEGFGVIQWKPIGVIFLSIALFAVLIGRTGLVPTTIAVTFLAGLTAPQLTWPRSLALALVLTATVAVIFRYGLGLAIPLFVWDV